MNPLKVLLDASSESPIAVPLKLVALSAERPPARPMEMHPLRLPLQPLGNLAALAELGWPDPLVLPETMEPPETIDSLDRTDNPD